MAADDAGNRSEVLQGIVGVAGITGAGKVGRPARRPGWAPAMVCRRPAAASLPRRCPAAAAAAGRVAAAGAGRHGAAAVAAGRGASGYRVVVSRDAEQTEWLSTQRVAGQQATLADLPEGVYVGVSAIGAQRLTGPASVQRFVVRLTPPAPFMLRPGKDSSQYGQQVGFAWAHVDGGVRAYEYEVAGDSDFRDAAVQPLRASRPRPAANWRSADGGGGCARSTPQGQPGPWSESVPFTELPPPQPSLADDGGDTLRIRWLPPARQPPRAIACSWRTRHVSPIRWSTRIPRPTRWRCRARARASTTCAWREREGRR